ncbi:hypothetical protein [Georgenia daeguensis]|uniref:Major facilitator superfamily (MFS) profile domain-containing protein n=1 Tax=Georgenia daeguensis TaxID=908355 RepID=A0ABP8EXT2_9MICO
MSPSSLPRRGRTTGARVLTAVVVTLGIGGTAGGAVAWLLRLLAVATGSRPDAGTAETFLVTMTFLVALLPGALATALERRRSARVLLVAGGVAVLGLLLAPIWVQLGGASGPGVGALVVSTVVLAGVVAGAVWATAWLIRAAVGPGGSGLAGPPPPPREAGEARKRGERREDREDRGDRANRRPTLGGGGPR